MEAAGAVGNKELDVSMVRAVGSPTVGRGKARLRTMPNATHDEETLARALAAFVRVRDRM